jgi:hypothetical protein
VYHPAHRRFAIDPVASFDSHRAEATFDLEAIFSVQCARAVTNYCKFSANGRKFQVAKENDLRGLTRNKILLRRKLLRKDDPS